MGRLWETFLILGGVGLSGLFGACNSSPAPLQTSNSSCAPNQLQSTSGTLGSSKLFLIDPITSSGNLGLSPNSTQLDQYLTAVDLSHLSGQGILKGAYVRVLNGIQCNDEYGAYDPKNQFTYNHQDWRFQEVMAYHFGDLYRSSLDEMGYLLPKESLRIIAHCMKDDNAYFERSYSGDQLIQYVCLGDSISTPGASYADDAVVTIHELQHATTVETYSPVQDLNQLLYDEAGAINEAISDFISLTLSDTLMTPVFNLDPRVFSRWALGTFDPERSHLRGTHKCPTYDSHYPDCGRYPSFELPSSSNSNVTTVSYVYPDGMGWPYPNNYGISQPSIEAFMTNGAQEEIHNTSILVAGALWDVYEAIQVNRSGDRSFAYRASAKLVLEALKHLPMPNMRTNHSPVTLIELSRQIVDSMALTDDLSPSDQTAIRQALKARRLFDFPEVSSSTWMAVGTGTNSQISNSQTPGLYVLDDPSRLQSWLIRLRRDPNIITQRLETGTNHRLDPGEVAVIWLDIQNESKITAGGVLVTVTSPDPDLEIMNEYYNTGYLSFSPLNETQVMYSKVNGTDIVSALNSPQGALSLDIGNSYFKTNPFFYGSFRTGIWVKVKTSAAHGKIIQLKVKASPSNGVVSTRDFPVRIN